MAKKQPKAPWTKFKVGIPGTEHWTNPDCVKLDTIYHVSHLSSALRIMEDGEFKAGLVFDKSKLRTARILVVWLSPNDWAGAGGFRYGNVRFAFEWAALIDGMNCYWIESIAYGIEACRILLTETNYASQFQTYDPTIGDGPWWYDKAHDKHYWNGKYCLEIMVEKNLPWSEVTEVDFVNHHQNYCCLDPSRCSDLGLSSLKGGGRFIAALAARGMANDTRAFRQDETDRSSPNTGLELAWSLIHRQLANCTGFAGSITCQDPCAEALSRAVLCSVASDNKTDMNSLASLFKSSDDLTRSCAALIAKTYGLSDVNALLDN